MDSREALVALNLIEHVGPVRGGILWIHPAKPAAPQRHHLLDHPAIDATMSLYD